jgi:hypothetical protein
VLLLPLLNLILWWVMRQLWNTQMVKVLKCTIRVMMSCRKQCKKALCKQTQSLLHPTDQA